MDLDALERDMRLTPAASNPFTSHAAPLQEGRRLAAQGQLAEACLATEAAARVRPCTVSVASSSGLCLPEVDILSCQGSPQWGKLAVPHHVLASQKAQGNPLATKGLSHLCPPADCPLPRIGVGAAGTLQAAG